MKKYIFPIYTLIIVFLTVLLWTSKNDIWYKPKIHRFCGSFIKLKVRYTKYGGNYTLLFKNNNQTYKFGIDVINPNLKPFIENKYKANDYICLDYKEHRIFAVVDIINVERQEK